MHHMMNCHGEWTMLAQLLVLVPFVGLGLRMLLPASVLARVKLLRSHDHEEAPDGR
jgi:hypothetical protein